MSDFEFFPSCIIIFKILIAQSFIDSVVYVILGQEHFRKLIRSCNKS